MATIPNGKVLALAFAGSLFVVPVAVLATEGSAGSTQFTEKPAEAESSDKLICRRIAVIGSRLKAGRVCLTSQQWAAKQQEDRVALERGQTQRYQGNQ